MLFMKLKRQRLILEIIDENPITTQAQLAAELLKRDVKTTQATISRDIKELHLIKVPYGSDTYCYSRPQQKSTSQSLQRMRRLFQENVVSYDFSENLILIKTPPGAAHSVAFAIDHADWDELLGTVAGDDTILVIIKQLEAVGLVMERIEQLLS